MQGLFFDCRYIRIDHHDGISRFSAGLFAALTKMTPITAVINDLRQLEKLPAGTNFVKISSPTSPMEPFVALRINQLGAKVFFSPMQTVGSLGRKFKLVLTVHDLIYYRHPAPPPGFSWPIRLMWRLYHMSFLPQRLLLNRADAIATVSNTTKELIAKHKLTVKPVSVIYNAPEADPELATGANGNFAAPRHRPISENQECQSLVYMGSFMDYKNVEVLIKGMAELPGYELDLLSRISPSRQEQLKGLIPANAKVNFHNGVTEKKYHELLTAAVALVSGSRDEGFGIPLVEAMSRGIPAVVSQIPIFKEIGGEAAIYFDQEDPRAFAKAVLSIQSDSAWLQKSKASQQQAKKFTWANSAKSLLELLNQI